MKAKQLQALKAQALEEAQRMFPDAARLEPCWTDDAMKVFVFDTEGRGQLHDVGVAAK